MRFHGSPAPAFVSLGVAVLAGSLMPGPEPLRAQEVSRADSVRLVEEARERQRAFEAYRASRIPVTAELGQGGCDERIGRMCIWFGGDDEADFPPEPPETGLARSELIGLLAAANDQIGDSWILGQLVRYLAEDGNYRRAEALATACGLEETWWCSALHGYVLHLTEDFVSAEEVFRAAVATMPQDERARWTTPGTLFTEDGEDAFNRGAADRQVHLWERFWRFSDPLFLLDGNDRLTEHFARLVEARNEEEAANAQSIDWGDDLEEALVRYGRTIGWSRTRASATGLFGSQPRLQDTRSVIGHHHPKSRGYLFPEAFLEAPADIPPESWITAPREARTWYAPPYAPDLTGLETQVGRFRRGDEMLVVGAYRPAVPPADRVAVGAPPQQVGPDPFDPFSRSRTSPPRTEGAPIAAGQGAEILGPVQAGLFLLPEEGGDGAQIRGAESEGVFTLRAPPGRYVSSIEVLEASAGRAWRARQGVSQGPLARGLAAVSDLLILAEDSPLPGDLEEAIPLVRPGVRVRSDERFIVAWEIYGLQVQEPIQVTLGFTQGRPGFLQRVGEFFGILEPDTPVEVSFADAGPDAVQTAFRAVALELPDLEPGEYTLHLRVELPGREPVIASRPITVES